MDTTPIDGDNFPCQCHLSQYAYTDDPCPECEARSVGVGEDPGDCQASDEDWEARKEQERRCDEPEVRLAEGSSDEEPELLEEPGAEDYSYFTSMTQDDWDADNDWLASAGWGEM